MKLLIKTIIYFFIIVISITPVFAQMQKIFSPYPEDKSFGYIRNFITDDTVRVVGFGKSGISTDSFNLSFYSRKNKKWENIAYSSFIEEVSRMNSYKNGRLFLYKSNNLNDTIRIYKLNNNNDFFVVDRIILASGVSAERTEVYGDWLIVAGQEEDIFSFKSTEYHWFFHYENGNWIKKDEYEFEHDREANKRYYSHNGIEINENFVIIASDLNDDNGYLNGKVTIYKKDGGHWKKRQVIYQPDPYIVHSTFGMHLSLAPDNSFLAIGAQRDSTGKQPGGYNGCIYIYKNTGTEWELYQKLSDREHGLVSNFGISFDITKDELLVDARYKYGGIDSKGVIEYYKHKLGEFKKVSEIHPPVWDTTYKRFGNCTDREGETVVTGAPNDFTYHENYRAAYIFQIPARDTVRVELCAGESFDFNDTLISTSGHYVDTLMASYGVDSVVQLYVVVRKEEKTKIDTVLCPGESIEVGEEEISEGGSYEVNLTSIYGCDSTIYVELDKSIIAIDSVIKTDYGCNNGSINLEVSGNNPPYKYLWENGETSRELKDKSSGEYMVTVYDNSGCEIDKTYTIPDSIPFLIPNAFFPDGQEEKNLIFKPYLAKDIKVKSMEVFDRWGEKVFQSNGDKFWDGKYKGKEQPPGVYLYRIEFDSPCKTEPKIGQVILFR